MTTFTVDPCQCEPEGLARVAELQMLYAVCCMLYADADAMLFRKITLNMKHGSNVDDSMFWPVQYMHSGTVLALALALVLSGY